VQMLVLLLIEFLFGNESYYKYMVSYSVVGVVLCDLSMNIQSIYMPTFVQNYKSLHPLLLFPSSIGFCSFGMVIHDFNEMK
jgi:hypothetical protein